MQHRSEWQSHGTLKGIATPARTGSLSLVGPSDSDAVKSGTMGKKLSVILEGLIYPARSARQSGHTSVFEEFRGLAGAASEKDTSTLRNVRLVVCQSAPHRIQMYNLRYLAETGTREFLTRTG